jgi:DNA (cytosine-5)-methyltransferase 1
MGMKILNLYAGLGGNAKFWDGHDITAVELNEEVAVEYGRQRPNDQVIIADAHQYLLDHINDGWDFIWASPPCPTHSKMMKASRHDHLKYPDMKLYQEIILLQHHFSGRWVVENVRPYYDLLIPAQSVGRHLFWANFTIRANEVAQPSGFITLGTTEDTQILKDWLGIQYDGNIYMQGAGKGKNHCPGQVLRNAVHPLLGKQILDCAIAGDDQIGMFA